ncbi:MAG TPA: glycosyltransferase, partial [bacterium]|nr:glycosyltransferase [bacterium]
AFRDVDASKGILWIYGFSPGYDGYPEYEGLLYSLASGSSAIEFKGRYDSDRVCDVLAEVDVIVVPSIWWENSPLTVHEAFQAGIPLVTADVGGMAEFVPNGVCGLQFHHRDWRSLQEVVNRICNQPEILNELRKGIPPVLSMEQHVQCLLTLYEKALHSR